MEESLQDVQKLNLTELLLYELLSPCNLNMHPGETKYVGRVFVYIGFTAGYPGCRHLMSGPGTRRPHTGECRLGDEEYLKSHKRVSGRLARQVARAQEWLTDQLQAVDDHCT